MSNRQTHQEKHPLVLAVDTSTAHASFAIALGEEILASLKTEILIPHSKTFFSLVSSILQSAGKSLPDIDVFAAATGPGSFTGLRVGLSAIKGVSHALGKRAIGISSIDAVILASKETGKVLAMIGAGRGEVYAGLRFIGPDRIPQQLGEDIVGQASSIIGPFNQFIQGEILTVARVGFNENDFDGLAPDQRVVNVINNAAEDIAICAAKVLNHHSGFDLHPHYVRPSDAEIKRKS